MKRTYILIAIAVCAVTGTVTTSQSLAVAGQDGLIYRVAGDGYASAPGYDIPKPMPSDAARAAQEYKSSDQSYQGRESKSGASSYEGKGMTGNYFQKDSAQTSVYGGGAFYGGPPTPSADPLVQGLSREPSMR